MGLLQRWQAALPIHRLREEQAAGTLKPNDPLPGGYDWEYDGPTDGFFNYATNRFKEMRGEPVSKHVGRDTPENWFTEGLLPAATLFGTAAIGGAAAAGAGGGGGSAAGGAAGYTPAPLAELSRDITAPLAGTGGGWSSFMKNPFSKGLDPTALLLGGLSLLGGDDGYTPTKFTGEADPNRRLGELFQMIQRMGISLGERQPFQPTHLKPRQMSPVTIPGVPFQIGGGLGYDPAMWQGQLTEPSPFQSPFGPSKAVSGPSKATRRRPPSGGK